MGRKGLFLVLLFLEGQGLGHPGNSASQRIRASGGLVKLLPHSCKTTLTQKEQSMKGGSRQGDVSAVPAPAPVLSRPGSRPLPRRLQRPAEPGPAVPRCGQ